MREARALLIDAARIYDRTPALEQAATSVRGFAGGAEWMALALATLRAGRLASNEPALRSELALSGAAPSEVAFAGARCPSSAGSNRASLRPVAWWGVFKYGAASSFAASFLALALALRLPSLALLALPAFYAIEAQMVFLFPAALDGAASPLLTSRRFTLIAGGTTRVMSIVMPIAATMIFGGLFARGFLRSWCIGCLAVCIWYERLRAAS